MDNVVEFPAPEAPDIFGPERRGHTLVVDGRAVPKVAIHRTETGVEFVLDNRLSFEFPQEWAFLAAAMLADGMAIAAGYPSIVYCDTPSGFAPKCGPLPGASS